MPSFRNRFRRNGSIPLSSTNNAGVVGSGLSFLGRTTSGGGASSSSSRRSSSSHHLPHHRQGPQQGGGGNISPRSGPPLATFDACIEACDALAASSSSSVRRRGRREEEDASSESERKAEAFSTTGDVHGSSDGDDDSDNDQGGEDSGGLRSALSSDQQDHSNVDEGRIKDCSVLVSPDGALLFTSQQSAIASSSSSSPGSNTATDDTTSNNNHQNRYPWTTISAEDRDGVILEEEYESAIICGNDLHPLGDGGSNGFSARGWNHDAATLALASSRDALRCMESFVEELATCRKEEAACASNAVGTLGGFREQMLHDRRRSSSQQQQQVRRAGPILSAGTNLSVAMEAMEEYYAGTAEGALERWRNVCSERPRSQSGVSIELKEMTNGKEESEETAKQKADRHLIQGMLPKLYAASQKAVARTSERERALTDIRSKVSEAETILRNQKDWSASQWKRVSDEEEAVDRLYAVKKMEQHEFYEERRRKQEAALLDQRREADNEEEMQVMAEAPLSEEVWEMVQGVATSMEDFGHTGYSPKGLNRKPKLDADTVQRRMDSSGFPVDSDGPPRRAQMMIPSIPPPTITRADVERESELGDLRMVAQAADESVEDAAGKLLNVMSKGDTTMRSARLAAESCLLSECNAAHRCLKSLVAMERASLEERARRLEVLEAAVDAIDVRQDIDDYIRADKSLPGGRTRVGDDDDGGVAAALAVLNSHGENGNNGDSPRKYGNIERPSHFQGWGDDGGGEGDEDDEVEPEVLEDAIQMLFEEDATDQAPDGGDGAPPSPHRGKRDRAASESSHEPSKEEKIQMATTALSEKSKRGQSARKSILYELNNQRSKKTQVDGKSNFDSLCRLFNSFLSGCGRESVDVSNAKMLMILSQTFYLADHHHEGEGTTSAAKLEHQESSSSTTSDRKRRIYVKSQICHHDIWSDEDFWDQAVYQCVSESLAKSGVLLNYVRTSSTNGMADGGGGRATDGANKDVKWHDLAPDEYSGAASQVHSVVFAQLGTLSHSMIELGCGIPRACDFVRRLSIRYQLPLSLRITLIQHLTKKRGGD